MDNDTDGEHIAAFRMFDMDNDGCMQKLGVYCKVDLKFNITAGSFEIHPFHINHNTLF